MDRIVRFWWIAWDNRDGTEGELIIRTSSKDAVKAYIDLGNVPYKKLVECYNDHDVTIAHAVGC